MSQPLYLRRLLRQKWLLIIGAVVSIGAGLLAGFTVVDGQIQSRTVQTFMASSTVLLTSPQPEFFQTEIPGTEQALPLPTPEQPQQIVRTEATPLNLSDSAIILAYFAASDSVTAETAAAVGGFEDGDTVTAVQRTTQPAGDERFSGRLQLPLLDIVGTATSPERAELIAAEATTAFTELVTASQDEWGVAPDIRLVLEELNAPVAGPGEGSNAAIPVIVVTAGVFLLFIALALIVEAVRERRRASSSSRRTDDEVPDDEEVPNAADLESVFREDQLVSASTEGSRRRR